MSDSIDTIKAHINGLRDTDAIQRYQEYAEMVELLDYTERLEAALRNLWEEINATFPASMMDQPLIAAMCNAGELLGYEDDPAQPESGQP